MEPFLGKWELQKSQGFGELLKQLGVDKKYYEIVDDMKNIVEFSQLQQGQYKFCSENKLQKTEIEFSLGKEFQENTPDAKIIKSIMTIENGVMKQDQTREGKKFQTLRMIENGQMKTVARFGDYECERWYKKL
ncbi:unnamed protein product [Rodentolepis nana]|uniref:FABP domain-containing protein n=1 Tax=Rodentolepis nana TaxID=102285 RepID=A0A0R3T7N4_RODNA|nr:unnamed protein product [Rodentolepis nana]